MGLTALKSGFKLGCLPYGGSRGRSFPRLFPFLEALAFLG